MKKEFITDNIKLYNDDCFNIFPKINDKSINLICCDLPFGTTANKWDECLDFNHLWKEYERILAPKGNIVLFGTGLFAYKLALSNEKLFRYDMIWKKSKCGSPLTAKYMPLKKHELLLVFGEPAAYYNPQLTIGEPYQRKSTAYKKNNMKYGLDNIIINNSGTRHPTTILDYPQKWRRQDQSHPTQKPIELLEWIINSYSVENDIVLDNCMGSNPCGKACKKLNRKFIGIEKDYQYFEIAMKNIS